MELVRLYFSYSQTRTSSSEIPLVKSSIAPVQYDQLCPEHKSLSTLWVGGCGAKKKP